MTLKAGCLPTNQMWPIYNKHYLTATGGTVATSGDFKIHSFTGDGCFVVSQIGNPAGGPNK
jgi:hypothetical protein